LATEELDRQYITHFTHFTHFTHLSSNSPPFEKEERVV
jgi:hypothetical protein